MYRLLKKTITAEVGERDMPKCIETACANKATMKVITADGQSLPLCATHYKLWVKTGAIAKRSPAEVAGSGTKRYGIFSAMFLAGISLILYNVFRMLDTNLFSIMSFTGLVLLFLSWLVGIAVLRGAYGKVRSRTLTEFAKRSEPEASKEQA
jgi:hypothetical protein